MRAALPDRLALALLLGALLAPPLAAAEEAASDESLDAAVASSSAPSVGVVIGQVLDVAGSVEVVEGDRVRPLTAHESIRSGQEIHTGPGSGAGIRFIRDGEIRLGADTRISFLPVKDPSRCRAGKQLVATVFLGEGLLWVVHEEDKGSGPDWVTVETPSAEICLTGTRVLVEVTPNGGTVPVLNAEATRNQWITRVKVLQGSAEVNSPQGKERWAVNLRKNFATVVEKGGHPANPFRLPEARDSQPIETVLAFIFDTFATTPDSPLLDLIDPGGILH